MGKGSKKDVANTSAGGEMRKGGSKEAKKAIESKDKFEAARDEAGHDEGPKSTDTIALDAMLNEKKPSEEPWEGEPEEEKQNFVQEELYIHAKLCIIDDRIVICGSANINDRSQLGYHDSELAIVMEDTRGLPSKMDGQDFDAGYHAATLRRFLWREHLGLLPAQSLDAKDDANAQPPGKDSPNDVGEGEEYDFVADPMGDAVWDMWTTNASTNTEVFRTLFHADPDDCGK